MNSLDQIKLGELRLGRKEGWCAAGVVALAVFLPEKQGLLKLCLFNRITGFPCPFCGLSRSFLATGHANFKAAARYNLLGIPLFVLTFGLLPKLLKSGSPEIRFTVSGRRITLAVVIALIAWLIKLRFVPRAYW